MKSIMIKYKNGFETICDGEITGYRTMFLFIPLGNEIPKADSKIEREFEFSDGTIWSGYIDSVWNDVKWHYGKNGELLGIKQKVSIRYTVKHESKSEKLKRFKIYEHVSKS